MKKENFSENSPGKLVKTSEGAWAYMPSPLPPGIESLVDLRMLGVVDGASGALGELGGVGRDLPNPHLLIRPFMRKEAEASSRIEGTEIDLEDLLLFEAEPRRFAEEKADVAKEVANYVRALETGLRRVEELPVGRRFVCELHEILMAGVRGRDKAPGQFRRIQNRIGGDSVHDAIYVPPPVPEMNTCFSEWERFLHAESKWPPIVRLAMIHYQFEAIHPFLDGNGRMGRLLIPILMREWGLLPQPLLYLSSFFERNRREYFDLLQSVSERGNWRGWIMFFLRGIEQQAKDGSWRAKMLKDQEEEYRRMAHDAGASGTVLRLVEELVSFPALTTTQVVEKLKVSMPTAINAIGKLEQLGVLRETTGKSRNRVWVAPGILDLLVSERGAGGRP